MQNRDYKQFAEGEYYHIFNRGNGKQQTYFDPQDYGYFISLIRENVYPEQRIQRTALFQEGRPLGYVRTTLPTGAFSIICYCLMPNHFHFLIRQNSMLPISKLMGKVCTAYAIYINKKYEKSGSLFQNKFRAVRVSSNKQLLWLSAYIHQNPHTAGLVQNLAHWQWSSYPDYIGIRNGTLCDKTSVLGQFADGSAYQQFVENAYVSIRQRKDIEHLLLDEKD